MAEYTQDSRNSQASRRSISPRRPISLEPVSDSPEPRDQPVNRMENLFKKAPLNLRMAVKTMQNANNKKTREKLRVEFLT
jgi:hypothetical protein